MLKGAFHIFVQEGRCICIRFQDQSHAREDCRGKQEGLALAQVVNVMVEQIAIMMFRDSDVESMHGNESVISEIIHEAKDAFWDRQKVSACKDCSKSLMAMCTGLVPRGHPRHHARPLPPLERDQPGLLWHHLWHRGCSFKLKKSCCNCQSGAALD